MQTKRKTIHCFVLLFLGISVATQTAVAQSPPPRPAGSESLGPGLLEGLGSDLPRTQPAQSPEETNKVLPESRELSTPPPPWNDLGEEREATSGPLSLVRVRQAMQQAQALLASPAIRPETLQQAGAAQQQAIEHLDRMIAEISNQSPDDQGQTHDQPRNSSHESQPAPPSSSSSPGRTAARDSVTRLGSNDTVLTETIEVEELATRLWGHLPPRRQEQMRQTFSERFLPKYESEIQQYYRRLSEDPRELVQP